MEDSSPTIADTEYNIQFSAGGNSLREVGLITVFSIPPGGELSAYWARWIVNLYTDDDDVFNNSFLKTVVICGAITGDAKLSPEARKFLIQRGNKDVVYLSEGPKLLPGPYACWGEEVMDVWKLEEDSSGTCMVTLKPQMSPNGPFEPFLVKTPGSQFHSFALPTRIRAESESGVSPELAGLRVVIKDNIHLKGIKTSFGSKAFYDTYEPKTESASCVQRLVELGMVVVGKTKMTSFGNWEEPVDYIDFEAPRNPRADGGQSPGGSSSGSAAAIASYEWLDIAIGTGTWGSVTRPTTWCGIIGFRPSSGALSPEGIEPSCQSWDTAGVLARDLRKCIAFCARWLSPDILIKTPRFPFTSIIWPTDYWSIIDQKQVDIARGFVGKIKAALRIECDDVSFQDTWATSPPSTAEGLSLGEYINEAANAQCYDIYHNSDDFRARYEERYGHTPSVSSPTQRIQSFAGKNANALVVMPLESMAPRYRNEAPNFPRPPQAGINAFTLGPVMKAPVLSIPIDEIPYHSRITDREEMLPFAVAVMSPAGTDIALMDEMFNVMKEAGMPTSVKPGRSMFNDTE
ncbi:amidase signature domain-containing protein [Nemania sp. FL0031]|nr:amidase signature domain-containing protein [Nemania sp. FL0031]